MYKSTKNTGLHKFEQLCNIEIIVLINSTFMGQIEDLRAFVQIVELGSIGKAAGQAGIAKSAMSRKLRLLEERMQAVLIARTTRQWALTETGREYYERGLRVLTVFDEFDASIRNEALEIRGEIKLSVPLYFGRVSLSSTLLEFATHHPSVHLNVEFSDRIVDVIAEQFDLVVRISELQDSSLIARELCQTRHVYCASPDYLEANTPIKKPHDIQGHRIIQFGSSKRPKWTFISPGGKKISVPLTATMNSHDGAFMVEAAEHGLGIVRIPDFLAKSSLDSGRLVPLLQAYELKPRGISIVYPTARYMPQRTRVLLEFLLAKIGRDNTRDKPLVQKSQPA